MTNVSQKLNKYTKLSSTQRKKTIKWLAKQNEELHLCAFEKQKKFVFRLSKIDEADKSILYLSAYYLAADELHSLLGSKKSKNKALNLDEIDDNTKLKVRQFKKHIKSEKYDRLLNIKNTVIEVIEKENLSYRGVSEFLKKYHRFEVSHSYIATFYRDIKKESK